MSGFSRRSFRCRIPWICLLVLLMMLMSGCRQSSVFDGSRIVNEDGFRMEYTVLDREETADLVLTEGDSLQVSLVNGSGTVDVLIGREGKEPVYRGTRQQNADFVLIVPESGTYRISVTGHRARGQAAFTVMGSRPE